MIKVEHRCLFAIDDLNSDATRSTSWETSYPIQNASGTTNTTVSTALNFNQISDSALFGIFGFGYGDTSLQG